MTISAEIGNVRQRVALMKKSRIFLIVKPNGSFDYPISKEFYCIVCKGPRLDPDITGLTCGDPGCLKSFVEQAKEDAELRRLFEIFCKKSGYDEANPEKVFDDLKAESEESSHAKADIEEAAVELGISLQDEKGNPKTITRLLQEISVEATDIKEEFEKLKKEAQD